MFYHINYSAYNSKKTLFKYKTYHNNHNRPCKKIRSIQIYFCIIQFLTNRTWGYSDNLCCHSCFPAHPKWKPACREKIRQYLRYINISDLSSGIHLTKNIAKRNPVTIRTKLNPTDCQKFPVKLSSKSFRTTETGDARRISCPRYILANCQIVIQKNTATMRIPV